MKIAKLKFTLVILLAVLCGCAKPEIRNLNSKGTNIICFGDSITFGYGVDPADSYPSVLGPMVKFPVINAGVDGNTTFDALERLETDVLEKDPRLVIVEFCGNDFLSCVPLRNTVENLSIIIDRIQAKGAMVALVDISSGVLLRQYRQALKKLAAQKKAIFIPVVMDKILTNSSMKSDFFHPNARGYKLIAERVLRGISEYLK
ncbi:MAG: GDSL-type esterase/lipase family protein [Candidatus Omnitrophica bacterium]|jgi:lysophospholipase L1-like esterase|nr:GDSL-type esterase/lipase family protein [Candidatus Omnitrophota bacterium]MDD3275100.1 GDSL-type esterase/lipase family protein [Candidatus Omnitrophota bacterium]MDD5078352.1 GDSL-type esterase/lipase family protein [Candidatus Omnitrophota bacterium]MDD5724759.1 GDSL-type esterase/lipase family protein [Candidatus Omnitrophota bacterium]